MNLSSIGHVPLIVKLAPQSRAFMIAEVSMYNRESLSVSRMIFNEVRSKMNIYIIFNSKSGQQRNSQEYSYLIPSSRNRQLEVMTVPENCSVLSSV